jgi:hypothetical protein
MKTEVKAMIKWTKEMRWNHIGRAAVILGIVPNTSKKSMLTVSTMLEARKDMVKKRKTGTAQSSPAWYKAKMKKD